MMKFRVDLDIFRGPLDLLLYLVRKNELEIADIPIALVTDQYLEHLAVLEQIDVNAVGDFLEMASKLIEIKSRSLLPAADDDEEPIDEAREELVRRLLEYKEYRDAASMLEDRAEEWRHRFTRSASDLPPRRIDPADQPIDEVELWDLVRALGEVMKQHAAAQNQNHIRYDDTPIHVYVERIQQRIEGQERISFAALFEEAVHKSALVGMFLALLELIRHGHLFVEQNTSFGGIWLIPGAAPRAIDNEQVSSYDSPSTSS